MSKTLERQKFIRFYKEKTGETEIDMHKVAGFAIKHGWSLPQPADPKDLLAKQFTDSARQENRRNNTTNRRYRAYHAVPVVDKNGQTAFYWIDIDDPNVTPKTFRKSAIMRRNQMVDDGVQLSLDLDQWNHKRSEEDQVHLPWDLSLDIEIRRAMLDEEPENKVA